MTPTALPLSRPPPQPADRRTTNAKPEPKPAGAAQSSAPRASAGDGSDSTERFGPTMTRALRQLRGDADSAKSPRIAESRGPRAAESRTPAEAAAVEPSAPVDAAAALAADSKPPAGAAESSEAADTADSREAVPTGDSNEAVAVIAALLFAVPAANGEPKDAAAANAPAGVDPEHAAGVGPKDGADVDPKAADDERRSHAVAAAGLAPLAPDAPATGAEGADGRPRSTERGAAPALTADKGQAPPGASSVDSGDAADGGAEAGLYAPSAEASTAAVSEAGAARSGPDFAAQLAQTRAAPTPHGPPVEAPRVAPAPVPGAHVATVATPLHAPGFALHFATEVSMLGSAGIERAEIRLQPPDLGPVRIELSLSGESTRVAFSAAHPETRQAIEQTLPILKELLAERGLLLGDASVSDGGAQADRRDFASFGAQPNERGNDGSRAGDGARTTEARRVALRRSLLDVYA
ncbi:MAG: flagellar hook-length control protein FliK [Burkholderiaceae bacterium]|nr:flagellar hook-length control protein FliK [Burkholderiaceae bacterium]